MKRRCLWPELATVVPIYTKKYTYTYKYFDTFFNTIFFSNNIHFLALLEFSSMIIAYTKNKQSLTVKKNTHNFYRWYSEIRHSVWF